MNRLLIASVLLLGVGAAPAFADCAADYTKAQATLKTAKLDDTGMAAAKDLQAKITDAITKKDEAACTMALADLNKLITPAP